MSGHSKWATISIRRRLLTRAAARFHKANPRIDDCGSHRRSRSGHQSTSSDGHPHRQGREHAQRQYRTRDPARRWDPRRRDSRRSNLRRRWPRRSGRPGTGCDEQPQSHRQRSAPHVSKNGGNMAETGAVGWMFQRKGDIVVPKERRTKTRCSASSSTLARKSARRWFLWEVTTPPEVMEKVREALASSGITPSSAEVGWVPQNYVKLTGAQAQQMLRMVGRSRSRRRAARLCELRY